MPDPDALLSIGDVAAATGISAETLRMWERRYGRPEAVRLPSGHRRYTQDQVRWLRRVAEALARGHRPHKVARLTDAELDALLEETAGEPSEAPEIAALLRHVRRFEATRLVAALRQAFAADEPVAWLEGRVVPLLVAVGRHWADGEVQVRHEHFLSEILVDLLRALRLAYPAPPSPPRVLLATLTGESHGLGLQMAALAGAARGVPMRILGVDTPVEEIVLAATVGPIDVVAISVSLATGGVETDRVLAALRAALPERIRLVVGGEGARGVRRGPRGIEYVDTLAAWDAFLADL